MIPEDGEGTKARFMPLDGLADTAEYTTRMLLDLISEEKR